jgi:uncharacterized protein
MGRRGLRCDQFPAASPNSTVYNDVRFLGTGATPIAAAVGSLERSWTPRGGVDMATAIVTGASGGAGKEIAKLLGARDHHVVLVARTRPALEEVATSVPDSEVVVADLGSPEGVSLVMRAVPDADILVNNAGFGDCGAFSELRPEVAAEMIQVNCTSLTLLCRAYAPGMLARRSGRILNIASTAAFQPGPTMAVYYATKAYVLSFTEALAEEFRGTGVTATAFCPGAFRSGFQEVSKAGNTRLVKGRNLPSAAVVAEGALRAMDRGAVVSVPGLMNKVGASMVRFTPRPVTRRVVHYVQNEA